MEEKNFQVLENVGSLILWRYQNLFIEQLLSIYQTVTISEVLTNLYTILCGIKHAQSTEILLLDLYMIAV